DSDLTEFNLSLIAQHHLLDEEVFDALIGMLTLLTLSAANLLTHLGLVWVALAVLIPLSLVALLSSLVLLSLNTLLDLCGPRGFLSRCSQGRQTKNARGNEETQICFSHHSNSMGETVSGLRRTPLASKGYAQMQF